MSLYDWAKNEVEIACKKENPDYGTENEEWNYGVACYQSALKAYESMLNDGHSGMSWELTVSVLNRLLHNQPLTPITDEDFFIPSNDFIQNSEEYLKSCGLKSQIQCPRMSSLFRDEYLDGSIKYHDVDRYYCVDIDNPDCTYTDSNASKILDELFPISMPYSPYSNPYKFECEEVGHDDELNNVSMRAYHTLTTPDGDKLQIKRFFKLVKDGEPVTSSYESASFIDANGNEVKGEVHTFTYQPSKWVEATEEEFEERKRHKIENTNKEATEETA